MIKPKVMIDMVRAVRLSHTTKSLGASSKMTRMSKMTHKATATMIHIRTTLLVARTVER